MSFIDTLSNLFGGGSPTPPLPGQKPDAPTLADVLAAAGQMAAQQGGAALDQAGAMGQQMWRDNRDLVGMEPSTMERIAEIATDAYRGATTPDAPPSAPGPSLSELLSMGGAIAGSMGQDAMGAMQGMGQEAMGAMQGMGQDAMGAMQSAAQGLVDAGQSAMDGVMGPSAGMQLNGYTPTPEEQMFLMQLAEARRRGLPHSVYGAEAAGARMR